MKAQIKFSCLLMIGALLLTLSMGCAKTETSESTTENSSDTETETGGPSTPTITPTPTSTPSPSATPSPSPSATATPVVTPTPTGGGSTSGRPASLIIENGATLTAAGSWRLSITSKNAYQMKISENSSCQGGLWEPFAAQKLWQSTTKNQLVYLSVVTRDFDEIQSSCGTSSILHDDLGPVISMTLDSNNTYLAGDSNELSYHVSDVGSGLNQMSCKLNQVLVSCQSVQGIQTFSAQQTGAYTFEISATDKLGNAAHKTVSWTVQDKYSRHSQSYQITSQNKVDILLITDNSGSMEYEQKSMASRMGTFISKLRGLDWKIGISTTDPQNVSTGDGRLLPMSGLASTYFITSSMNETTAQTVLGQTIQRKELGYSEEQGIYVTSRSIERSLNPNDKIHYGFYRPEAALAVVVISDEDESATGTRNKPENLIKQVQSSFGANKKFVFHSIITRPGDTQCRATEGYAYGYTYERLSKLTGAGTTGGAIIGSVCEADYANQLSGIGTSIQDMKRTLDLKCAPGSALESSIQVSYEGKPYLERYLVQGSQLVFDLPLTAGKYDVNYLCP